jgi:hypothetical protein
MSSNERKKEGDVENGKTKKAVVGGRTRVKCRVVDSDPLVLQHVKKRCLPSIVEPKEHKLPFLARKA